MNILQYNEFNTLPEYAIFPPWLGVLLTLHTMPSEAIMPFKIFKSINKYYYTVYLYKESITQA